MFKCESCKKVSLPQEKQFKKVVEKYENGNIKREISVCKECK